MLFEQACPLLGDKECREHRCAWYANGKCAMVWLAKLAEEHFMEIERKELRQQRRERINLAFGDNDE